MTTLLGMAPALQNGGLSSSILRIAVALLHMNGIVTPALKLISRLEIAALNSTNREKTMVSIMAVTRSTGKLTTEVAWGL